MAIDDKATHHRVEQLIVNAGTSVVRVDPKYTSQICSGCGAIVRKDLSERWHSCECGTELDRDHNAALNILHRYQNQQDGAGSVPHKPGRVRSAHGTVLKPS